METGNHDKPQSDAPQLEDEVYSLAFHKWPFLIAVAITLVLYVIVFVFVDPNPPYYDPSELPPPPIGG